MTRPAQDVENVGTNHQGFFWVVFKPQITPFYGGFTMKHNMFTIKIEGFFNQLKQTKMDQGNTKNQPTVFRLGNGDEMPPPPNRGWDLEK
jgi:hypothetical protein